MILECSYHICVCSCVTYFLARLRTKMAHQNCQGSHGCPTGRDHWPANVLNLWRSHDGATLSQKKNHGRYKVLLLCFEAGGSSCSWTVSTNGPRPTSKYRSALPSSSHERIPRYLPKQYIHIYIYICFALSMSRSKWQD